jgi:hypothetical protein
MALTQDWHVMPSMGIVVTWDIAKGHAMRKKKRKKKRVSEKKKLLVLFFLFCVWFLIGFQRLIVSADPF